MSDGLTTYVDTGIFHVIAIDRIVTLRRGRIVEIDEPLAHAVYVTAGCFKFAGEQFSNEKSFYDNSTCALYLSGSDVMQIMSYAEDRHPQLDKRMTKLTLRSWFAVGDDDGFEEAAWDVMFAMLRTVEGREQVRRRYPNAPLHPKFARYFAQG